MPDQETKIDELQTVAENLADIEAEPGVNAFGESIEESSSIDYQAIASEAIEMAILQELEARYASNEDELITDEETLSIDEIFRQDAALQAVQGIEIRAANNPVMPEAKAYKIELDGVQYYCWFPAGAEVGITDDGYLYNETANNITGIIATDLSGVSLNSYNDSVTIAPLLNTSGNNNAFRYGSRVYISDYYSSGNTLNYTTTYVNDAKVIEKPSPGYGFSRFQIALLFVAGLIVLFSVLRFLWRDK